ncbi:VWA domain-containing protein [Litorivicinus lipolyticus]|uniref:VWA domain-containing protein n=1 Tax=Litorivicinus lipolyticus TaxID=418701 RepID=A0A5Q2QEE3_9GAMM|nr:vWA domain-containing protein [Litorivicinus lipolyticus]QGG80396.1 VWA domain-containing protein [Litorivicinus lipolyticus]
MRFLGLVAGLTLALSSLAASDLRVLIDVSGSMKANDPESLRRPAAELIARLLPAQSRAGVWLFGTDTRTLVNYGNVDDDWRSATLTQAEQISSADQFTDIENALSMGLAPPTSAQRDCHVILVTDGLIDLKAGAAAIRESRARIESQLTRQAVAQDCRIHTLGLSSNADLALLSRLAQATGGLSASLSGAAELIPVLINALEIALPNNQLPVSEGRFTVDDSVKQQTVIALKGDGENPPLVLRSPSGRVITPESNIPGIEYEDTAGYQLYQITDPELGEWTVVGNQADRVFVESQLELALIDFPSTVEVGQPINLVTEIKRDGTPITAMPGLRVSATISQDGAVLQTLTLTAKGDLTGFQARLPELAAGDYQISVLARAAQIERKIDRSLRVIAIQAAAALESDTTQAITQFKAPARADASVDTSTQPASEASATPAEVLAAPVLQSGLTLSQWLWAIGGVLLAIIIALAFWLARAEKKS